MARRLIAASAVQELLALEPLERRRAVVARLSEILAGEEPHRLCAPGRCRAFVEGVRVLYVRRPDGASVVVALAPEAMP